VAECKDSGLTILDQPTVPEAMVGATVSSESKRITYHWDPQGRLFHLRSEWTTAPVTVTDLYEYDSEGFVSRFLQVYSRGGVAAQREYRYLYLPDRPREHFTVRIREWSDTDDTGYVEQTYEQRLSDAQTFREDRPKLD
jgi:hypothetical protein